MKKTFAAKIRAAALITALALVFMLAACDGGTGSFNGGNGNGTGNGNVTGSAGGTAGAPADSAAPGPGGDEVTDPTGRYSNFDLRATYDERTATKIVFSDGGASVDGAGASADGTSVLIVGEGTYIVSGSCSDGQLTVEVKDKEKVQLVFDGLKLASKTKAPLWIKSGDKVSVTLADGTVSTLEDNSAYTDANADGEPNACMFSKVDLTINGTGTLNVHGNVNNGITTKDDLKIVSGTVNVTAKNHGIRGNDSVSIRGGNITVTADNDGIKTSKDDDPEKGYIYIEGGTITVTAGDDCFQAVTGITATAGSITATAGGKRTNCPVEDNIADGVMK